MINLDKKKQLIEELLAHLDESQGADLRKMVEEAKAPKVSIEKIDVMKPKGDADAKVEEAIEGSPEHEAAESPAEEMAEMKDDAMGEDLAAKGDDEKLSDEELAEMLKKYMGQ